MCHYGQDNKGPGKSDIRGILYITFTPSRSVKFFLDHYLALPKLNVFIRNIGIMNLPCKFAIEIRSKRHHYILGPQ